MVLTACTSLFFAEGTGIVAVIFDMVKPENLNFKEGIASDFSRKYWDWKFPRWSDGFAITFLLLQLCGMVVGIVILSDGVIVNTPSGKVYLPALIIYPLAVFAMIVTIALVYWMVYTRSERSTAGPEHVVEST
jgi:hypothetical protein